MAATGTISTAQQRRSFSWFGPGPLLYGTALVIFLGLAELNSVADASHLKPESNLAHRNDTGICKSVDIRNTLDTFEGLNDCRVVEGFVQILLFDKVNETQLAEISFPKLTEITDYLLLYRVNGLRSVGQLFPNLAVIRGQNKFFQYSFVVFEMPSLQDIGLYSLTDITSGYIRIDKNPSLCFVNSIDWDRIVHDKGGENFIKSLKTENECPACPGDEKENENVKTALTKICPILNEHSDRHLCWNRNHCQKICPKDCLACNANGTCCSKNCLGGCSINDTSNCAVCRNVTLGLFKDRNLCSFSCPTNTYKYLERRCITREECITMKRPLDFQTSVDVDYPYKTHNSTCILQCPQNYMNNYTDNTCTECHDGCKKECGGINIDSLTLVRQLRGCTHITGSLEIQIRGGSKVVNELEENLSMIEEIGGYLKIVRSYPLYSLNFLKSLKTIRGNSLENSKYAVVVLDNQNLQELWDWKNGTRKIEIKNGSLFFHFNPRLCINQIEQLQKQANLRNFTSLEVAPNSNGDKVACEVQELNVTIDQIQSKGVILKWKQFEMNDQRKLLGYTVYYTMAPNHNVTLYDGRDACGGDGWQMNDVAAGADGEVVHQPVTNLKPYTKYALYVKTYTIANEKTGAQSKLLYFTTKASAPSLPVEMKIFNITSSSISASWLPPLNPNGNIVYYQVLLKIVVNEPLELSDRNFCNLHATSPKSEISLQKSYEPDKHHSSKNNCSCDDQATPVKSLDEKEQVSRINFEDALQNKVYIKKNGRNKRDLTLKEDMKYENKTENGTNFYEQYCTNVTKPEVEIKNLRHATTYLIEVIACRQPEEGNTERTCSDENFKTIKTNPKAEADKIRNLVAMKTNDTTPSEIMITWKEPKDPNGVIFSYSIEYKQVDNENSKSNAQCITHTQFLNSSRVHILRNLYPGNYSLCVYATTSAGNGPHSPFVYFYVEEPTSSVALVVTLTLLVITLVLSVLGFFYYRKWKIDKENMRLIPSVNPIYVPSVYVPDDWEVPRKKIELKDEPLGQGSFGLVYEGIAKDIRGIAQIRCAVKTVNEHATNRERLEFLNEASVMKAFDTAHVVKLLGVVSLGQPLVIMEFMANGDLKSYLRSHRPDDKCKTYNPNRQEPTLKQILQMAVEIADGMAYLSAKKFVHRDLAARNCMVADDLTVKIGDFGMTRDIYETDYYRKGTKGLLPVRWMAPESLKDGVFTSSSDVWSYGVVLWEMATLASQPYQGLSNDQVLRYVIDGGVMQTPDNCPSKLYSLMTYCWQHQPSARPTFMHLCTLLLEDAYKRFAQVSFYHSTAGAEIRASRPTPSPSQDDPRTPLRMAGDLDTPNTDDDSDDDFGISDKITTANGYVSGRPTNGAATTQC